MKKWEAKHCLFEKNAINEKAVYAGDDCTIISLSSAIDISYDFAKRIYQRFDFNKLTRLLPKNRTKGVLSRSSVVFGINSYLFEEMNEYRGERIEDFVNENSKGTYVVAIRGHIFTVKHGIILEADGKINHKRAFIDRAYEVNQDDVLEAKLNHIWDLLEGDRLIKDKDKHFTPGYTDSIIDKNLGRYKESWIELNTKEFEEAWDELHLKYGFEYSQLGQEVSIQGNDYTIAGIDRRSKYAVVLRMKDEDVFSQAEPSLVSYCIQLENNEIIEVEF